MLIICLPAFNPSIYLRNTWRKRSEAPLAFVGIFQFSFAYLSLYNTKKWALKFKSKSFSHMHCWEADLDGRKLFFFDH